MTDLRQNTVHRLDEVVEAIFSGMVLSRQPPARGSDSEVSVINSRDIQDDILAGINEMEKANLPMSSQTERYLVQEGDVLVSARGAFKVARVGPEHISALAGPNLIVIRPRRSLKSWLLYSFLRHPSTQSEMLRQSVKTTVASISITTIADLRIRVPDLGKQLELARAVELAERQYALGIRIVKARRLLGHETANKDLIT